MQIDQDSLKTENTNLVAAFREKSRKHQQTQELYDRLKRKEMTAATQSAAFESVDEVLGNVSNRQAFISSQHLPRAQAQRDFHPTNGDHSGNHQANAHHRSGSNNSQKNGGTMPPPPQRPVLTGNNTVGCGWTPSCNQARARI